MEKQRAPTSPLALSTIRNEILNREGKSSSSDDRPTRGKFHQQTGKNVIKNSTPLSDVSPLEFWPDYSAVLRRNASFEEKKFRRTDKSRAIKRPKSRKVIERYGKSAKNEENFLAKSKKRFTENLGRKVEKSAGQMIDGKSSKTKRKYVYFEESDWETDDESSENMFTVRDANSARKSIRRPKKSGKSVESSNNNAREGEKENIEKSLFASAESQGEAEKLIGENSREKLAIFDEDIVNVIDGSVESERSPEKIRREPPRCVDYFHSPVLISRVGRFRRKIDEDSPAKKYHELPTLKIYDEIQEDIHVEKEKITRVYPVKRKPCASNAIYPTFSVKDSNDVLWEKFVEENQYEMNAYMHDHWARVDNRREILDENLESSGPERLGKRFFVGKGSSNLATVNTDENISEETSKRNRESSTDSEDTYDFSTDILHDGKSKIKICVRTIEDVAPKKRSARKVKRSEKLQRISPEIRHCNRIIEECDRKIRYHESNYGYKEKPWQSGHSFHDWEDTQRAFIRPKISDQSSGEMSAVREQLLDWPDKDSDCQTIEAVDPSFTIQPTKSLKRSNDLPVENSLDCLTRKKKKLTIISNVPFRKRVKLVSGHLQNHVD